MLVDVSLTSFTPWTVISHAVNEIVYFGNLPSVIFSCKSYDDSFWPGYRFMLIISCLKKLIFLCLCHWVEAVTSLQISPPNEHSWSRYGQKLVKGSSF